MTPTLPDTLPGWIKDHIELYLSDGEAGHMWTPPGGGTAVPTLLLFTRGRRSGDLRVLPLIYGTSGEEWVVIASKGGAPDHPAWYLNLVADPNVEVQVASERFAGTARIATGEERNALWSAMAEVFPPYNDYQAATDREIPVVVLGRA